jgi:FkbM family methyltransferase
MIKILKKIIPEKYHNSKWIVFIKSLFVDIYKNVSYSQEGEDLILKRIFEHKKNGFYIDVGAHHPKRFSNTFIFYKMGWRGINIDAMPGSMKKFKKSRPKDLNIEAGIMESPGIMNYYIFNDTALNTFNEDLAKERGKKSGILKIVQIQTYRLYEILEKYLPLGTNIDFLTVDAEGFDLEVLSSNNWEKYHPDYILVEITKISLDNIDNHVITKFLKKHNYKVFCKTFNTVFFKQDNH